MKLSDGFSRVSVARVQTPRPARYAKQLISHMSRKVTGTWDDRSESGYVLFTSDGLRTGQLNLDCEPGTLVMTLYAAAAHQERLEHVAGVHLARFGRRDQMVVSWLRSDGTPGATDGPFEPDAAQLD